MRELAKEKHLTLLELSKLAETDKNIDKESLRNILHEPAFNKIMDSRDQPSIQHGKLKTCALKCGRELDQFGDQYK